jgi:hypothetical protein
MPQQEVMRVANSYAKNQVVRISVSFTASGVATDPTTVTLVVQNPAGTETTYTYAASEITKSATGAYYKDVTGNVEGDWYYWWYGTGTCGAADQGWFTVTDLLA